MRLKGETMIRLNGVNYTVNTVEKPENFDAVGLTQIADDMRSRNVTSFLNVTDENGQDCTLYTWINGTSEVTGTYDEMTRFLGVM